MKKTALLLIFSITTIIVFAGKIEKAYEALKEYNYFKAKQIFEKSLTKKKLSSSYGLSIIFTRDDNPFHNLDSAYKYICVADSSYIKAEAKDREKLKAFQIDSLNIQALKDTIDKKVYKLIRQSKNIAILQKYIDKHIDSYYRAKIIHRRNKLLFKEVKKENTAAAYSLFIKQYPDAKEIIEAQNRYEERLFVEQTFGGKVKDYQSFIVNYSDSPYLRAAQDSVYAVTTRDKSLKSYYSFVKNNPHNPHFEEAWRQIYKRYMTDYSPARILEFKIDYPDYPFVEELKMDIKLASKKFYPYQKDGKWGFIDEKGMLMISPQYQSVEEFSDGLALVVKNNSVGYIDKTGNTIIPFDYEDGESFQNGFAIVSKNGFYGFIDRLNREIVPIKYEFVSHFNEGIALIADENYYGYCNLKGEIIIPLQLDYASDFKNGYAIVEIEGKKGVINTLGKVVVSPMYSWIEPFNEYNLSRAKKDTLYGVIDRNGAEILPFLYDQIGGMNNNRALVTKEGKYGYINSKGELKISLEYDYLPEALIWGEFKNGYAKFLSKDKYGIIDTTGEKVFPAIFQDVGNFQPKGYTAVKKRGKWGYSDHNLKLVIPYIYDYTHDFNDDKAIVKKDSLFGIIDKEGEWLLQPEYDKIEFIEKIGYIVQRDKLKGLIGLNLELYLKAEYHKVEKVENSNLLQLVKGNNSFYYNYINHNFINTKPLIP